MAHTVAFCGIEKQHLVRLGYGLIMPKMTQIDAAIGKHQFCGGCELFRTLMPAVALAVHVSNRNCRSAQQRFNGKLRQRLIFVYQHTLSASRNIKAYHPSAFHAARRLARACWRPLVDWIRAKRRISSAMVFG